MKGKGKKGGTPAKGKPGKLQDLTPNTLRFGKSAKDTLPDPFAVDDGIHSFDNAQKGKPGPLPQHRPTDPAPSWSIKRKSFLKDLHRQTSGTPYPPPPDMLEVLGEGAEKPTESEELGLIDYRIRG